MHIAILENQTDSFFNDSLLVPWRNTYVKFVFFLWKSVEKKYFLIKDSAADEHTQNQQWTPHL